MKKTSAAIVALLSFLLSSCDRLPKENKNYFQDFSEPVAWLVIEGNGYPLIMASGFLVNREKGIIMTAKHFTDELPQFGGDRCKAFLNGKVYEVQLLKAPALRDAVLLRIRDKFNPADLPEPYPLAKERVAVHDKVFLRGFHPHPRWLTDFNKNKGVFDKIVPVLRDYYQIIMRDSTRLQEIVFEDIEGNVAKIDAKILVGTGEEGEVTPLDKLKSEANLYVKIVMRRNHGFSFAGLSGGPIVNSRGELVGILTAARAVRFKIDPEGFLVNTEDDLSVRGQLIARTVQMTPIVFLRDLFLYADEIK